ncbi:cytochrome aa3 quinol oxidase subunit II [Ureibacillus manganicus]|uniref:Quinol oxidase polypeptide II n=1 Tax=Ureibacillus manganicus DSM 26584 TaxID=1384049 RepID=A0A0A3I476_9BACL|nr:cytochrome aa3 quinol oxidase subunit II [Ureibacillus manganicus]KGR78285.1 quinol oxidase subunit 2 [Ureibacillus manganicus DSM 26584]
MKLKWALLVSLTTLTAILAGCEPLMVLDPKGPMAARQASDIMLLIVLMSFIVIAVLVILAIVLFKYRASKMPEDYEPPHIEGNIWVEVICIGVPIIIVAFLSFVSIKSNYIVESAPTGYEEEPLVIYASSSDWKWHFSYPEQGIETVNYLYIPTNRPLEFKLYSYGPITSFWIPQLGGQKYAMADMVTTLHLAADEPGEMMGRNANFSGKGFTENTFNVTAMSQKDFDEWVEDVYKTADPITEEEFNKLLEPGHLGQMTFTGTHLDFSPAPEHNHGSDGDETEAEHDEHSSHDETNEESDHSGH